MGYAFTRDDIAYLSSAAGAAALAEVGDFALSSASLLKDLERIRRGHGERSAALVETVRLRRRAAAKLADSTKTRGLRLHSRRHRLPLQCRRRGGPGRG
ncbi:hypothetical protein ACWELJ_32170, partial [Nocardia sp. NPDC004582]